MAERAVRVGQLENTSLKVFAVVSLVLYIYSLIIVILFTAMGGVMDQCWERALYRQKNILFLFLSSR
ncbi:hypothetical protein SCFA_1880005 [anaerobic digester metagenome]|uniref:Uncharacterized protein n=1 Tax=anaerobic digester metagenome TaxID=1263854 RepID=A0A485LWS7_9ZZZZ